MSVIIAVFVGVRIFFAVTSLQTKLKKITKSFAEKKYDVFLKEVESLSYKDRKDPRILWMAANMYADQKQYVLSMVQLQNIIDNKVFSQEITETQVYKMLARVFEETDNYVKAMESYEIALKLNTNDFDSLFKLGMLAYKNNSYDAANQYFLKALEMDDKNTTLYYLLSNIAYLRKGYKLAEDYIKKAIEIDDSKLLYHLLRGKILYSEKNYAEAAREFLRSYASEDLKNESAIWLGNTYYKSSDYDNAKKYYAKILHLEDLKTDGSILDERYRYAEILVKDKEFDKALSQWQAIKKLRSTYLDVDDKIRVYSTIINNPSFRTALQTEIVEYLEKHLYRILTLNGYIVTGHVKKSETLIYFTTIKKFAQEGQSYKCAFALDTSGYHVRKDTVDNFFSYTRDKQAVHSFVISVGGFASGSNNYDNIEFIEPERFEAILDGVISFSD